MTRKAELEDENENENDLHKMWFWFLHLLPVLCAERVELDRNQNRTHG